MCCVANLCENGIFPFRGCVESHKETYKPWKHKTLKLTIMDK